MSWEFKNKEALIGTHFDLEEGGPRIHIWARNRADDQVRHGQVYWGGVGAFIFLPLKALKALHTELGLYIEYMEKKRSDPY